MPTLCLFITLIMHLYKSIQIYSLVGHLSAHLQM